MTADHARLRLEPHDQSPPTTLTTQRPSPARAQRASSGAATWFHGSNSGERIAAICILAAAPAMYLFIRYPPVLLLIAAAPLVMIAIVRIGALATALVAIIIGLVISAALARYVAGAGVIAQLAVAGLVVLGFALGTGVHLSRRVRLPAGAFLLLSTVAAVFAARRSIEFGVRAWVGLVLPVAGVMATAAILQNTKLPQIKRVHAQKAVVAALLGAVALNLLFGLRQALLGMTSAEITSAVEGASTYKVGDQIRLMGVFESNQDFGLFVGCCSPALLAYALLTSGRRRRIVGTITALMYFVTFLSLMRTALIAGLLAGVLAVLLFAKGPALARTLKMLVILVAVLSVVLIGASQIDSPRVQDSLARATTLFNPEDDPSYRDRTSDGLPYALDLVEDHPMGLGPGAAGPVSSLFNDLAPVGEVTTDNGYLMIAIQLGLLGLGLFVLMLVNLGRSLCQSRNALAGASGVAVSALLIAMLLGGFWSLLAPIGLLSVLVGLGVADADWTGEHRLHRIPPWHEYAPRSLEAERTQPGQGARLPSAENGR